MEVLHTVVGIYQTNCYIVVKDGHALIIDPGSRYEKILAHIPEGVIVDAILLTHAHVDHIGAVDKMVSHFHCPIYISEEDALMAKDPHLNISYPDNVTVHSAMTIVREGILKIGPFSVKVIETPGHTAGSLCFIIEDCLFSGDTLFYRSVGRCDLPTGNEAALKNSLRYLATLDPSLKVYPGHERFSTLEEEIASNPWM